MRPQYAAFGMPGGAELLVVALVMLTPVLIVIWLVRNFSGGTSERKAMRKEIARLADEVTQLKTTLQDTTGTPRAK